MDKMSQISIIPEILVDRIHIEGNRIRVLGADKDQLLRNNQTPPCYEITISIEEFYKIASYVESYIREKQ